MLLHITVRNRVGRRSRCRIELINAPNNWPPKLGSESRSTFNGTPDNLQTSSGVINLFPL